MPTFVSKEGKWEPAKEKTHYHIKDNKGNVIDTKLHDGPDREATRLIKEQGSIGMEAKKNPEMISRARQMNMSVDEFIEMHKPVEEVEESIRKNQNETVAMNSTENSPKKKGVKTSKGNFGEAPIK